MKRIIALLFGTTHRMTFVSPSQGTISWNTRDPQSIEKAKAAFDEVTSKGGMVVRENSDGTGGDKLKEFDVESDQQALQPIVAG